MELNYWKIKLLLVSPPAVTVHGLSNMSVPFFPSSIVPTQVDPSLVLVFSLTYRPSHGKTTGGARRRACAVAHRAGPSTHLHSNPDSWDVS